MNSGIWRCQSCYRVNRSENALCSKCGLSQHPDPEPGQRTAAKVVYFFQTIVMLFGIAAVLAFKPGFLASILILLIFWWCGLMVFAVLPVGGTFDIERRAARAFIEFQTSLIGRRIVQTAYAVLFWPTFISKNVYFWSMISAVVLYYTLKFLYGI